MKYLVGLYMAFMAQFAFALDTTGITTAIGAAGTDIDTVAIAIFGVIGTMFAISKIRQVAKA